MMDKFSQWGITKEFKKETSGEIRARFLVHCADKSVKVLKRRRDVVLFLAKNPQILLSPEEFDFELENKNEVQNENLKPCQPMEQEDSEGTIDQTLAALEDITTHDDEKDKSEFKRIKLSDQDFEDKILKVTVKERKNSLEEDYGAVLEKLHLVRLENANVSKQFSAESTEELKEILIDLEIGDDPIQLVKKLCQNKNVYAALKTVLSSNIEAEMDLVSVKGSKFVGMSFPVEQSSNFYCDILNETLLKMPNLLSFIVNIVDSETDQLTPCYAIKIATLICEILSTKDRRHAKLKKLNALHVVFQKSAVGNLKTFGHKGICSGYTETARLVEEMAELSDFFKNSNYRLDLGMQFTADNVDCVMKGNLEHWMLAYSRMDPIQSKMLSDEKPFYDIKQATHEIVYLSAEELKYLKKFSKVVLAKKLFDMKIGFTNILHHVPYKPIHEFPEMLERQDTFYELLEPLNEMQHTDVGSMLLIIQRIALERLNSLTDFKYKSVIEAVINQTGSAEELCESEAFVKKMIGDWGEVIIGGDLLTVERIIQNLSLRNSNSSEFEKCGFIGPPRIAVFHYRQNLVLKLLASFMPNLNDSSCPGSLNAFRALTEKAKHISNLENKVKESLELHYQFLLAVSESYVEEKIATFAIEKYRATNLKTFAASFKDKGEAEIQDLLDEILEDSSHSVFFEETETIENLKDSDKDDLENIGDFFVSLWLLLKSLDFITKSGDPTGIELFKKNGILLTLSIHSTASKYVHYGFQELVRSKSMSNRLRLRFNSGSFVKYHGRQSLDEKIRPCDLNNRSEDMVCEWMVAGVKSSFKSLGGNFSEETIERKMKSMPLVTSMLDQDCKSLMIETSWDRFEVEDRDRFREYVRKLKPFRPSERKLVKYNGNMPKSLYSNLSKELIQKFFDMKIKNMS